MPAGLVAAVVAWTAAGVVAEGEAGGSVPAAQPVRAASAVTETQAALTVRLCISSSFSG
jgi:hypothetical protein